MSDQIVSQAAEYIRAGKNTEARQILMQVLKQNPRNEDAWLLLVQVLPTDAMRISALEQCLKYFPQSQGALLGLEGLTAHPLGEVTSSVLPPAELPPVPRYKPEEPAQAAQPAPAPELSEPNPLVLKPYHSELEDVSRPASILAGLTSPNTDETAAPSDPHILQDQLGAINAAGSPPSRPGSNAVVAPQSTSNAAIPTEVGELRAAVMPQRPRLTLRSGLRIVLIVFYAVVLIGGGWAVWQRYGSDITAWFKGLPQTVTTGVSPPAQPKGPSAGQTSQPPILPVANGSSPQVGLGEILYLSNRNGVPDLYINHLDGKGAALVLASESKTSVISDPAWSVDGNQIAFVRGDGQKTDLFTASADGSGLVVQTNDHAGNAHPSWAPDGNRIVFVSQRDGGEDLYILTLSSGAVQRLTNNAGKNFSPAWSPDGNRIAFVSDRDGFLELFLINPDGSGLVSMSTKKQSISDPAWSPDSQWIAFASAAKNDRLLYVTSLDGSVQNRITFSPGQDDHPTWSPDGAWIVFSSARKNQGQATLYIVRSNGQDMAKYDPQGLADTSPVWSLVIKN